MNREDEVEFRGKRILVVEDEVDQRDMLMRLLTKNGYEVDVCASYEESLPFLTRNFYHIVLSDIRLNGEKDGFDVLAEVRRVSANTSVIIMTAYASIDTAVQAMTSGAVDYIQKPINLVELKIKLEKAILLQHYLMNTDSSSIMRTNINILMGEIGEFRLTMGHVLGLAEQARRKIGEGHPSTELLDEIISSMRKKSPH